jgi:hypothetical protein
MCRPMSKDKPTQAYLETSLLWEIVKRRGRIDIGGESDQLGNIEDHLARLFDIHPFYREWAYSENQDYWRTWIQFVRKRLVERKPPEISPNSPVGQWEITSQGTKRLLLGLSKGRHSRSNTKWTKVLGNPADCVSLYYGFRLLSRNDSKSIELIDNYIRDSAGLW